MNCLLDHGVSNGFAVVRLGEKLDGFAASQSPDCAQSVGGVTLQSTLPMLLVKSDVRSNFARKNGSTDFVGMPARPTIINGV